MKKFEDIVIPKSVEIRTPIRPRVGSIVFVDVQLVTEVVIVSKIDESHYDNETRYWAYYKKLKQKKNIWQ